MSIPQTELFQNIFQNAGRIKTKEKRIAHRIIARSFSGLLKVHGIIVNQLFSELPSALSVVYRESKTYS